MSTYTSSCLLCGSPCKEHAFVIQSNDDDPDSVLEDIQRLDRAIDRLRILKIQRYRQLNSLRSLTRTLPNEILLSIFQFFCSLSHPTRFPQFILGGVCSHWRNLVNTEPRFWRSMNLTVKRQNVSRSVSLLEVFKERNRTSFEFMKLMFERLHDRMSPFQRFLSSIRGVSTLSRIVLHDPPVDMLRIINDDLITPDVRLIGPLSYFEANVPEESLTRFSTPWSSITILKLHLIQVDICVEFLLGCPNLVLFSSDYASPPTKGRTRPNTYHAREVHFPHLQHLTWHHEYSNWDNNFLSFYRFPALEHFCWHGHEHWHSIRLFRDFTSLLPPSCRMVHLSAEEDGEPDLGEEILRNITHPIEQLICSQFDMYSISIALERLQDPTFIPSLNFFKWEHQDSHWASRERVLEFAQIFRDVLWTRRAIGVGRFRMEIGGMRPPFQGGEIDRKAVYDVMGGDWFRFEVAEDGNWIMFF